MNNTRKQSIYEKYFSKQETTIGIATVILIAALAIAQPAFISPNNIFSLLGSFSFVGIVAIGEALIIMTKNFDISVGSVAGMGAIVSTTIMVNTSCFGFLGTEAEWFGVLLCVIISTLICGCMGLLNAFLVVTVKLTAFITTIATLYLARGIANVLTKGVSVSPLPETVNRLGELKLKLSPDADNGISYVFIIFVTLIIVFEIILRKTSFGRSVYATGSNINVARLAGINVNKVQYICFIITAMLAGFSGFTVAAYLQMGYSLTGNMWELLIIASVVVGGVSMTGGKGSMIGVFIGVVLIHVMSTGLVTLGINTFLSYVVQGCLIIAAVLMDNMSRRRKIKNLAAPITEKSRILRRRS